MAEDYLFKVIKMDGEENREGACNGKKREMDGQRKLMESDGQMEGNGNGMEMEGRNGMDGM